VAGPQHTRNSSRAAGTQNLATDVEDCGLLIYERLLPAVAGSVTRMRGELADALARHRLAARRRDDILLVVTEAATNAVWHAYRDSDPGPLYVAARLLDRSLIVVVVDRGRWTLPRADGPGLGLGLSLMTRLTDDLEISHDASRIGTCVQATFDSAADRHVAVAAAADNRGEMLREYLRLLTARHASLHQDTRAILAQAEQAVAYARRQQRERARRR
jgi:serine/threonine-protein kinase RsbW/stage II sporulation protein AB (anti-sigma F factor)